MIRWIEPMECLTRRVPDSPEWAYEVKWDGYRALGSSEWLLSRRGKPLGFKSIRDALRDLGPGTVLDGEVVALDGSGIVALYPTERVRNCSRRRSPN
jgi:bifunctional non-homologous end joining protein LigD